jgi:hypothetical protein
MSAKHKPDHEMEIMRRGLRDLARLPEPGRRRVLAYWCARAEALPATAERHGEQQLDIEEVPMMPALKGAA